MENDEYGAEYSPFRTSAVFYRMSFHPRSFPHQVFLSLMFSIQIFSPLGISVFFFPTSLSLSLGPLQQVFHQLVSFSFVHVHVRLTNLSNDSRPCVTNDRDRKLLGESS